MSENQKTVDAEVVDAEAVPASLTVQDLVNIRNIIDVASGRGAFKAAEFKVVGETFEKLESFIAAITPAQGEGAPAAPAAPAEAPAAEAEAGE